MDSFNVKDYGAAGNGRENDTAAIQNAVIEAGADGVVYFPEGVYLVSVAAPPDKDRSQMQPVTDKPLG